MANNKFNKPAKKQVKKFIIKKSENPMYFSQGILLKVNLPGVIGGPVVQTGRTIGKKWFPSFSTPKDPETGEFLRDKQGHYISGIELNIQEHYPREQHLAYQQRTISPEVLKDWASNRPAAIDKASWAILTPDQRITYWLSTFDQGLGISVTVL
jgi:hypothetical protein